MRRFGLSRLVVRGALPLAVLLGLGLIPNVAMAVTATAPPQAVRSTGALRPQVVVGPVVAGSELQPAPTGQQCVQRFELACYAPSDIQTQYGVTPLLQAGIDGTGQTIVIFEAFGSPTIRQDLATFDQSFGLPAPPSFRVYRPEGPVKASAGASAGPAEPGSGPPLADAVAWAYQTTLSVEWAHAIAPGANIALVVTPATGGPAGMRGLQDLTNAEWWALRKRLGSIWVGGWGVPEAAFTGPAAMRKLDRVYVRAASEGVTAFFGTGDSGVENGDATGRFYRFAGVNFPSSSAAVVSVGGTEITSPVPQIGWYQPERVWNGRAGAAGGGYSTVVPEPAGQAAVRIPNVTGMRGTPDVSWNAALSSSVLIYQSFDTRTGAGWALAGGTGAAAAQWAAAAALAGQADGKLGFLAPRLYQIYADGQGQAVFHDVTEGVDSFGGVRGYAATLGWDPASGLGTPDVASLIAALRDTSPAPAPTSSSSPAPGPAG